MGDSGTCRRRKPRPRLREPAATRRFRPPDINTNARGCVTSSAALWALALLVVTGIFAVVIVARARQEDAGLLGIVFCLTLGPLILLTIGAYVAARTREDQLADEEAALAALAGNDGVGRSQE